MSEIRATLANLNTEPNADKIQLVDRVQRELGAVGYTIAERNDGKPWGAYLRLENNEAGPFINDFFPGLTLEQAQLGIPNAELSPKILMVSPDQKLSWQYHDRRAERWAFLNEGGYYKSETDDPGELVVAQPGDVVQFLKGERHRLVSRPGAFTLVAEIWQHADPTNLSNEDDIVRLQDDYQR